MMKKSQFKVSNLAKRLYYTKLVCNIVCIILRPLCLLITLPFIDFPIDGYLQFLKIIIYYYFLYFTTGYILNKYLTTKRCWACCKPTEDNKYVITVVNLDFSSLIWVSNHKMPDGSSLSDYELKRLFALSKFCKCEECGCISTDTNLGYFVDLN